jgi:hypothetical protein
MNKTVASITLLFWIGTTICLDLLLAMFSLPIVAATMAIDDATPYYERYAYRAPIYEVVLVQVGISLLFLAIGIVWSALVLLISERLLIFLKYPTPQNHKFSHLSLTLFKIALAIAIFTVLIGNISSIYDHIQARTHLNINK